MLFSVGQDNEVRIWILETRSEDGCGVWHASFDLAEIGSGFREPGGTPLPRIPKSIPQVTTIFKNLRLPETKELLTVQLLYGLDQAQGLFTSSFNSAFRIFPFHTSTFL